jgi:pyrimidine operon attenuation protein/uracil phosphoribosyltransferase
MAFICFFCGSIMEHVILKRDQLQQKIQRIAYQIFEENQDEESIVIAGVHGNGYIFAKELDDFFKTICQIRSILLEVEIDKTSPFTSGISVKGDEAVSNQPLVLVDDVLNTGGTLVCAMMYFINKPMKKIKTAVLVDRNHHNFPIAADFVGMSLATTFQEHIEVRSENGILKEVVLR